MRAYVEPDTCLDCGAVSGVALCDYCGWMCCDECARDRGCPVACSSQWEAA